MKVLLVIHGYPPRYNAGSEVYTQTLANALFDAGCEVEVFAREEDPFLPDYHLRSEADPLNPEIPLHLVNHARSNARFQNDIIDSIFSCLLDRVQPDLIHFGHFNHLSMGMPKVAKERGLPTLFTLHDYIFMCPRGQFLRWGLTHENPWTLCSEQVDGVCASKCFNRFLEGVCVEKELSYWTGWVEKRMEQSRSAAENIDLFIAPSRRLMSRHVDEFGLDASKVTYLDYGFDLDRLERRRRVDEDGFVFGYIGRHHPSKGIHHLIDAFARLNQSATLRIWGRSEGQVTQALRRRTVLPEDGSLTVEWLREYENVDIVREVFDLCDCIVVPSIWDENSPLVIHEAQQCGVPVITADHGGMGEYVQDGVNGLTFAHRDSESLRSAMQTALNDPEQFSELGRAGYLHSEDGQIPSKEAHAAEVIRIYETLLSPPVEVTS